MRGQEASITDPVNSLVLVLNIISQTHARPTTGVVLAGEGESALVLVPAGFVSAGDDIIVLDGGTDIQRHGRATRTVARSGEAGLALLEVSGLIRNGVEISSDGWPEEGVAQLELIAWPEAEALAEGAPLARSRLRLLADESLAFFAAEGQRSGVAGPLFDRCGRLAAFYLAGEHGRAAGSTSIRALTDSAGFQAHSGSCAAAPAEAEQSSAESAVAREPGALPSAESPSVRETPQVPQDSASTFPWLIAALLVVMALAYLLRRRGARQRSRIVLEGKDSHGREVRHRLDFSARSKRIKLESDAGALEFALKEGHVVVSDCGEEPGLVVLALDGTPCLPGESFVIRDGQHLQLGEDRFRVQLDIEGFESADDR